MSTASKISPASETDAILKSVHPEPQSTLQPTNHPTQLPAPKTAPQSIAHKEATTVSDSSAAKGPYASRLEALLKSTVSTLITKAEEIDSTYKIRAKVTNFAHQIDAKYAVVDKAQSINETYRIQERAESYMNWALSTGKVLDEKYHILDRVEPWKNWVLSY